MTCREEVGCLLIFCCSCTGHMANSNWALPHGFSIELLVGHVASDVMLI